MSPCCFEPVCYLSLASCRNSEHPLFLITRRQKTKGLRLSLFEISRQSKRFFFPSHTLTTLYLAPSLSSPLCLFRHDVFLSLRPSPRLSSFFNSSPPPSPRTQVHLNRAGTYRSQSYITYQMERIVLALFVLSPCSLKGRDRS